MVPDVAVPPDYGPLHDVRESPDLRAGPNLVALANRSAMDEDAGRRGHVNRASRSLTPSALQSGFECGDAEIDLRRSDLGIDRQTEALASPILGDRECTRPIAERGVGFQLVQGEWIVDPGADPSSVEGLQHVVAAGQPDHIEMMDAAGCVGRAMDLGYPPQCLVIMGGDPSPGGIPFFEVPQFRSQGGGLQGVEPAVEPDLVVMIFCP